MRLSYPPYDFLILIVATLTFGVSLLNIFFTQQQPLKGLNKLTPFAIAYIPLSLIFAFLFNELPLKFYLPIKTVYEKETISTLGPQSVNREGVIAAGVYILSVVFNFIVWGFSLFLIIRYYVQRTKQKISSSIFEK